MCIHLYCCQNQYCWYQRARNSGIHGACTAPPAFLNWPPTTTKSISANLNQAHIIPTLIPLPCMPSRATFARNVLVGQSDDPHLRSKPCGLPPGECVHRRVTMRLRITYLPPAVSSAWSTLRPTTLIMAGNLNERKIPTEGDSSRQQPDPNSIQMQQTQDGQLPPAYEPSPSMAPVPLQPPFQQPQQAHLQQSQFAQPQQQYFIQLPNGTMQAVPVQPGYCQPMPQQPIVMMPVKDQPTIVVNNTPSASAAAAGGGGGGGGGGGRGANDRIDSCVAGFCGGCAACLCCSVM